MDVTYLSDILKKVSEKSMDVDTALESLKHLPYEDIGYANIDQHRNLRTGDFWTGQDTGADCRYREPYDA